MQTAKKIKTKPIGGYHGITVELPTVQMNIDYEEGRIEPDRGYSRLLPHPAVRKLEKNVSERYCADEALAFASPESALFVLMDILFRRGCKGFHLKGTIFSSFYQFLKTSAGDIVPETAFKNAEVVFENISDPLKKTGHEKQLIRVCREPVIPACRRRESTYPNNEIPAQRHAGTTKQGVFGQALIIGVDREGRFSPKDYRKKYDAIIIGWPNETVGFIVFYDKNLAGQIKALRRHTGYDLNSRKAARLLVKKNAPSSDCLDLLKLKLAHLEKTQPDNVFLYPTGMAAISSVVLTGITPERSGLVMIGSPYTDTRSLLEKWPERRGTMPPIFTEVDDPAGAENAIDEKTALVICETPTNPLLRIPDLKRIVDLAHRNGAKVLVDNTIATPFNLNPFDYAADMIVHSSTKFLNGMNDHIGGVLLVREQQQFDKIEKFNALININMDPDDAAVLHRNLEGFTKRMKIINRNALSLANYLDAHPKVRQVYYPGLPNHPDHKIARHYFKGFSGLMSFVLAGDVEKNTHAFYDNLGAPILKGPSLGSEQSLICLYTILAHYNDPLEKLARMGLEKYLLRISVGTEDIDDIINAFEAVFEKVDSA